MSGSRVGIFGCTIFLLIGRVTGKDPEFAKELKVLPEVLNLGDTATLQCYIAYYRDQPGTNLFWVFQTRGWQLATKDEVESEEKDPTTGLRKYSASITDNSDTTVTYTLKIRGLSLDDDGVYACKIGIPSLGAQNLVKTVRVLVMSPPKIQPSTRPVITTYVTSSANMTCDAAGNPRPYIKWKRVNGSPLPDGKLVRNQTFLYIPHVKREHAGLYRCTAINNVIPLTPTDNIFDVKLDVQFKPTVKPAQRMVGQTVKVKVSASLECYIEGNPAPIMRWYRPSKSGPKEVKDDENYQINEYMTHGSYMKIWEKRFVLRIKDIRAAVFGNYKCLAENIYGETEAEILLYQSSECQGVYCESRYIERSAAAAAAAPSKVIFTSLLTLSTVVLLTVFC